ncbi:MAG: deoxyribonuclease IV [Bacillota bacterium]|nr:deoxyribonuclease IV [Bacillota bacterium]
MLRIGCHLSTAKGFQSMTQTAVEVGANTFQFFTRNPRGGKAKKLEPKDIEGMQTIMKKYNIAELLAHASYTINMCSQNEQTREFARMAFADDLDIMEKIPCNLYTFHPGSHTGQGIETGIEQIVEILNSVIQPEISTSILLETMSGKGSEVGRTFEEIRMIIDNVTFKEKLGVCLDTCHIYSAGYDIVNDLDGVLNEFDRIIGLERLKAVHLNDSMHPLGSNKDRHAAIGEGTIGFEAIRNVIRHPKLKHLPFLLETPNELEGYAREIKLLREHQ